MPQDRPHVAQLPLGISLAPRSTFAAFFAGPNGFTVELVRALAHGSGERQAFLVGETGLGKSHLLQAACHAAGDHGGGAAYMPLGEVASMGPAPLTGMERIDLLALDDVDSVVGQPDWEEALFDLINRAQAVGCRLVMSGRHPPAALAACLADLASRLAGGPVVRLEPLSDEQKQRALCERARTLGIDLSPSVANYLIRHYPRDLAGQLERLGQLDRASLAAGRRLTVPFVKEVLG